MAVSGWWQAGEGGVVVQWRDQLASSRAAVHSVPPGERFLIHALTLDSACLSASGQTWRFEGKRIATVRDVEGPDDDGDVDTLPLTMQWTLLYADQ